MAKEYDVIIIGAGPAGSYLAGSLARMGHSVLVLEQRETIGEKLCCTGIVGRDFIEQFPVSAEVILRRANSARLFSPSGKLVRVRRPETQAYILNRPALDRLLAKQATAAGAEYLLSAKAQNVTPSDNGITVEIEHQGETAILQAKAVVLATGFASPLVNRLGAGRIIDFTMGAQAEVEAPGLEETEVYVGRGVAPGFFGWLVPASPGKALAGVMTRHQPGTYLKKLMSALAAQGKIVTDDVRIHYGCIPLQTLHRSYGRRWLAVGDAAGQAKPTSGGGIYYGLLCARIAAEVMYRCLEKDDFSAASLSVYEKRWRKRLGGEMRTGRWFRRVYEGLNDRQLEWLFHALGEHGIAQALGETEELSFDYHGKVLVKLAALLLRQIFISRRRP